MLATTLQVRNIAKTVTSLPTARYTNKSKASKALRHLCFKATNPQHAYTSAKKLQTALKKAGYTNLVKVTHASFYGYNDYVRVNASYPA